MNIYLDIEGVLLRGKEITPHLEEFLKYITDNHTVYWLTTHCKGDSKYTIDYLKRYLDNNLIKYLEKIKETNWNINKIEAIDFSKEFRWLDDYVSLTEQEILKEKGVFNNWLKINLNVNINILKDIINKLK